MVDSTHYRPVFPSLLRPLEYIFDGSAGPGWTAQ